MSARVERAKWPKDLIALVKNTGHLCLNVANPGWDDARSYLLDENTTTLYFPVAKKYLPSDPNCCQVLVWSRPRVLLTGDLRPATSDDDTVLQLRLAEEHGMAPDKAAFMLLDQRTRKARRTRYKLVVYHMTAVPG